MKNLILFLLMSFSINLSAQKISLSESEKRNFINAVEQKTKAFKTIQTDFIQVKHMSFLSNKIESHGKMYFKSDGVLKWEYTEPNKYSVLFKSGNIYINDNGKKTTVTGQRDISRKLNQLISGSFNGKLFNDSEFNIKYFKSGKFILVELTPKDKTLKKYIKEVNLFFPENTGLASKVKLIEPSGDYTDINFKNTKSNVSINSSIFNQ